MDGLAERIAKIRKEAGDTLSQAAKRQRCAGYLKTAEDAKNEAAMYRYHQGLIDDAKRREKEAKDRHFSECYGSGNY